MIRKIIIGIGSIILSAFLMFSIPIINYFMNSDNSQVQNKRKTAITIKKAPPQQPEKKRKKTASRPKRSKPVSRSVQSGPRFAMDLNVAGLGDGVGISLDLVKDKSGGGGARGDVDQKPRSNSRANLQPPASILEAERDAFLLLSFCVDAQGNTFDVRVVEENPSGKGLAEAGKRALADTDFEPAVKDNSPIAYCGLEQPFEIKFRD